MRCSTDGCSWTERNPYHVNGCPLQIILPLIPCGNCGASGIVASTASGMTYCQCSANCGNAEGPFSLPGLDRPGHMEELNSRIRGWNRKQAGRHGAAEDAHLDESPTWAELDDTFFDRWD